MDDSSRYWNRDKRWTDGRFRHLSLRNEPDHIVGDYHDFRRHSLSKGAHYACGEYASNEADIVWRISMRQPDHTAV